jgi:DNA-binding SARP family transcriptional activator
MHSVIDLNNLTASRVLELREQGYQSSIELVSLESSSSAILLLKAFEALDQESAECISYLRLATEKAGTPEDRWLCSAVALVAVAMDIGTIDNVAEWNSVFAAEVNSATPNSIVNYWLDLGQIAASTFDKKKNCKAQLFAIENRLLAEFRAIESKISSNTKIISAQLLLEHANTTQQLALVDLIVSIATNPKLMSMAQPVTQARFYERLGFLRFNFSRWNEAKDCWRRAKVIAQTHQLDSAGFMASVGLTRRLLDEGAFSEAEQELAALSPATEAGRGYQVVLYKHLKSRYLLLRQKFSAANLEIDEAIDLAIRLGLPQSVFLICYQEKAQALFMLGEHERAEQVLHEVHDPGTANPVNAALFRYLRLATSDPEQAHLSLLDGLQQAEKIGFTRFLRCMPKHAAQVCLYALEKGICTNFVVNVVSERQLQAPEDASEFWPWPLRIKTFGGLVVTMHGEPLVFPGRTQAKPLELLCYLASCQGMQADNINICAALWVAEDPTKSSKNLESTIARLRKLLGNDDFVRVANGQVSLNKNFVWCDWAYVVSLTQHLIHAAIAARGQLPAQIGPTIQHLLDSYKGPFLIAQEEVPWLLARRDASGQNFVAAAQSLARIWESTSESQPLFAFLEAALIQDPLSETITAKLMQAYAERQHVADSLRIYRFFRSQLSLRAGLQPSAKIENLKKRLCV